jgi:small GTP-binding protein
MEMTKKIVLMGQFGVGKSSLARRYMLDIFETDYMPTLGVQIKKKIIVMPSGKELSMIIWDLEGFTSVSKTRASYLLGSNGFVYVFDISRPFTYHQLDEEIAYITNKYSYMVLKVIGNKKDLADISTAKEYLKAKSVEVDAYVSAKTGEGVQELFLNLANTFGG